MIFTEDWYPEADRAVLKKVAQQCQSDWGSILECGSWEGQSAIVIESVFGKQRPLIVVDPWDENHDQGANRAFANFIENTKTLNIAICRQTWKEFFTLYKDPISFIHIDAIHEYEEVKGNILAALPLMQTGGVMCGHDYAHGGFPGVKQAVDEIFGDSVQSEANLWWHLVPYYLNAP